MSDKIMEQQTIQQNKIQKYSILFLIPLLIAIVALGVGYYIGLTLEKNKVGESQEAIFWLWYKNSGGVYPQQTWQIYLNWYNYSIINSYKLV